MVLNDYVFGCVCAGTIFYGCKITKKNAQLCRKIDTKNTHSQEMFVYMQKK